MQMHNFFPPCPPGGNSGRGCFLLPQEESRFLQLLVQKRIRGGGLTALEPQWFSFRQTLPSWEGDRLTPLCWFLPCSFVSWSWLEFLTKSFLELAGALATSDWFVRQRCASCGGAEGGGVGKLSSVNLSGASACSPFAAPVCVWWFQTSHLCWSHWRDLVICGSMLLLMLCINHSVSFSNHYHLNKAITRGLLG